ncbi:hydroxyacylglutathione hydrolase cytoplasmic [Artemisia annua]|uniref:Hydroxyacylglutathione hydrolase cytoplasmic n=1 Tax=Artemisia annua TaxID=35608 RepID=A0A2U1LP65_ARTAN|nr:hydroxyacylglutathione hydrolase cytoplasmic [Artemisia annua]
MISQFVAVGKHSSATTEHRQPMTQGQRRSRARQGKHSSATTEHRPMTQGQRRSRARQGPVTSTFFYFQLCKDHIFNTMFFAFVDQFVAVCGKFFEGTADQMYQSLCVTLASLPKPNQVYCGHEFAQTVEPDNAKISRKLSWAQQQRHSRLPTIPSTIKTELEIKS